MPSLLYSKRPVFDQYTMHRCFLLSYTGRKSGIQALPLYPAPLTCQSGAWRWWAFDVLTIMCCTSLQVREGLRKGQTERNITLPSPYHTCMDGFSVCGSAAYLASKVRAMTPAATEEEREVSGRARLQLSRGPRVTCWRHPVSFSLSVFVQPSPGVYELIFSVIKRHNDAPVKDLDYCYVYRSAYLT